MRDKTDEEKNRRTDEHADKQINKEIVIAFASGAYKTTERITAKAHKRYRQSIKFSVIKRFQHLNRQTFK